MASDRDAQALHLVERNALDRSGRSFAPIQPTSGTRARRAFLLWARAASSRSRKSRSNASRSRSPTTFPGLAAWTLVGTIPSPRSRLAWDREQDIIYVIKATPPAGSNASRACWALFAHGERRCHGLGRGMAGERRWRGLASLLPAQYTAQGLNMLYQLAQFEDG